MVNTLNGLEKAASDLAKKSDSMNQTLNEMNIQILETNDRLSAIGSRLDTFLAELRAALAHEIPTNTPNGDPSASPDGLGSNKTVPGGTPPMTIPTFDGSDAIAWLARAEQYFLVSIIPPEKRVGIAKVALAGPAVPWFQLLQRRIPTLSWDRFTQELLRRFGDAAIAAIRVAKIHPKIPPTSNDNAAAILPSLPTVTTPLLSSSPPTTALQEIPLTPTPTIHPDIDTKANSNVPLPLAVQKPIPPPVLVPLPSPPSLPTPATPPTLAPVTLPSPPSLPTPATPPTLAPVTAPLLSTSGPYIPQFQPPFLPLLQYLVPATADHTKLMVSSTPPTTAMMTAPLLSASPNNLQIPSPFLLRCLVSAAHLSMPMAVSFPGSLFSSASTPFSYLVLLRFLHIVGHFLWFTALATTRKHEFEPPPDKVIGFNFDLRLEGKAVLRARQLIRIEAGRFTGGEIEKWFGQLNSRAPRREATVSS